MINNLRLSEIVSRGILNKSYAYWNYMYFPNSSRQHKIHGGVEDIFFGLLKGLAVGPPCFLWPNT